MGVEVQQSANLDLDAEAGHEVGLEDRRPKRPAMIAVDVWDDEDGDDTKSETCDSVRHAPTNISDTISAIFLKRKALTSNPAENTAREIFPAKITI